ncbi:MAG: ABC transporter permease [Paracoccaceae bacterium]
MGEIAQGAAEALALIARADAELIEIATRSLAVSLTATLVACVIGLPLGAALAVTRFRGRGLAIACVNALMGLPPVVVGLTVYLLLSRSGPLGVLGLLYTPTAMVIAQAIVVTPLVTSIAHRAMGDLWADYADMLAAMGVGPRGRIATLLWDGRAALMTAALAGFGRAIGEVGAVMIVGGNIDRATRVLTTAIALETSRGAFATAMALGFVLIALALAVNLAAHWVGRGTAPARAA